MEGWKQGLQRPFILAFFTALSLPASPPRHWLQQSQPQRPGQLALERATRLYNRSAALVWAAVPRFSTAGPNSAYFLGRVPWDISEQTLVQSLLGLGRGATRVARRRLHKPTLWLALPRIPGQAGCD